MKPLDVARGYFDAWNRRDSAAIVAAFAEGGTYADPLAGTLTGPAIGAYAAGLFAAFPDLSFDIVSAAPAGDEAVAAQWLMRGTNSGPFRGTPPTGRAVALPGADFIAVDGDRVRAVQGYFDSRAVPEQLGLQVIVQPRRAGPFTFGTGAQVHSGSTARPGAFGLTVLTARSPDEVEEVQGYSRRVAQEMLAMPGFIGWLGVIAGDRMFTITAWEKPEDARPLMRGGAHKEAMDRFFSPTGVAACASTSVWQPHHLNPLWVRCITCGQMVAAEGDAPRCACGADLPRDLPYW
jgi:steroid delta-isomerase-like uncharacterized protein